MPDLTREFYKCCEQVEIKIRYGFDSDDLEDLCDWTECYSDEPLVGDVCPKCGGSLGVIVIAV